MENIIKAGVVVYAALFLNVGAAVAAEKIAPIHPLYATHQGANTAAVSDGGGPQTMGIATTRQSRWS